MNKQITTLEEIEREQKKLKITMELTKESFIKNVSTNQGQLKELFVKKIAIPGGLFGLGYATIKSIARLGDKSTKQSPLESSSSVPEKMLPLALSLAQAYFFKKWKTTENKETESPTYSSDKKYPDHPLKKVG